MTLDMAEHRATFPHVGVNDGWRGPALPRTDTVALDNEHALLSAHRGGLIVDRDPGDEHRERGCAACAADPEAHGLHVLGCTNEPSDDYRMRLAMRDANAGDATALAHELRGSRGR